MIFYYLFSIHLLLRLLSQKRNERISYFKNSLYLLLSITSLFVFTFNWYLVFYFISMITLAVSEFWILRRVLPNSNEEKNYLFLRYGTLVISICILVFFSYKLTLSFPFNFFAITEKEVKNILIYSMLFLFNLTEANLIIRGFILRFNLKPEGESEESNIAAGRLIGIFERIIIFIMTILNEIGAIGFIIAAKSIARYKKLDEQDFAEYMIIGTLISSTFAVLSGLTACYLVNLK